MGRDGIHACYSNFGESLFWRGCRKVRFEFETTESVEYKVDRKKKKGKSKNVVTTVEYLAAKEGRFEEDLEQSFVWHKQFAEAQLVASDLADMFNEAVLKSSLGGGCTLMFIKPRLIQVIDRAYPGGTRCILAEKKLETDIFPWRKWNSNDGKVVDYWPETNEVAKTTGPGKVLYQDFLQAFSHYTYETSNSELLVCDLQGVFLPDLRDDAGIMVPCFELTDPVIHDVSGTVAMGAEDGWGRRKQSEVDAAERKRQARHGRTDRRQTGISDFFDTHECNGVCRALHLNVVVGAGFEEDSGGSESEEDGGDGSSREKKDARGSVGNEAAEDVAKKKVRGAARSRSRSKGPRTRSRSTRRTPIPSY
mmetsp:Transcript_80063/g.156553  ORF Transcript_80063/g.156553 Transcript_80063/m.156553 type:complete len:364 (-) Transcript_80063:203-1294(-)